MTIDSCGKPKRRKSRVVRRKSKKSACGKRRTHRRGKSRGGKKGKKCARPGPIIRNAFLNFLRDFRRKKCGKSMTNISKEAAKKWKCMSICKKSKYIKMACNIGGRGCGGKKRQRSRSRKRSSKRSKCGKKRSSRRRKKKKRC